MVLPLGDDVVSLGCRLWVRPGGVEWSLDPETAKKWIVQTRSHLESGSMRAAEASNLAGRLLALEKVGGENLYLMLLTRLSI